jgi:hypothetical protein
VQPQVGQGQPSEPVEGQSPELLAMVKLLPTVGQGNKGEMVFKGLSPSSQGCVAFGGPTADELVGLALQSAQGEHLAELQHRLGADGTYRDQAEVPRARPESSPFRCLVHYGNLHGLPLIGQVSLKQGGQLSACDVVTVYQ